jgi:hypothetical protein
MHKQRWRLPLKNLNVAIRKNGSDSEEAAVALRDFTTAQQNLKNSQSELNSITKQSSGSLKGFALGASGAAIAGLVCIIVLTGLKKRSLRLTGLICRCALPLRELRMPSETSMEPVVEHGANSAEAKAASEQLSICPEAFEVANERVRHSQDNVNQAMMASAIQVIPSAITMVDSLGRAWKNFPDMAPMLKTLSTNVADVGNKAAFAAIGVGSFVGDIRLINCGFRIVGSNSILE